MNNIDIPRTSSEEYLDTSEAMTVSDALSREHVNKKRENWLLVVFPFLFVVFAVALFITYQQSWHYKSSQYENPIPTVKINKPTEKLIKLEEIITSEEQISSSLTAPNNTYAFAVTQRSSQVNNIFKDNENSPVVIVFDNLVFINIKTKEKREFVLYDLASSDIVEPLRAIPVRTQYMLYVHLLKWSADSTEFWGAISLVSSADPPVNEAVSLFKIGTTNWSIERFTLPGHYINTPGQQNLNLAKKAILFESATPSNGLTLYEYNLLTDKNIVVVSYTSDVFEKYLPGGYGFLDYFHPSLSGTESRQLEAKWLDSDTISYTDFDTREEVIRKSE